MRKSFEQNGRIIAEKIGTRRLLFFSTLLFTTATYLIVRKISEHADETTRTVIMGVCLAFACILILSGLYYFLWELDKNKKINTELKYQQKQLLTIFSTMTEGLITTNNKGKIVYANAAAEQLSGWKYAEMKGLLIEKMFLDINTMAGIPVENIVAPKASSEDASNLKKYSLLKTKEDQKKIITNRAMPLIDCNGNIDGVVLVFSDETKNAQTENKLKQAEEKYNIIVDEASDAIIIYSFDGLIHDFNKSTCTQLGYTPEEFKKLKAQDLLFDGPVMMDMSLVDKINNGETTLFTRKIKRKDGSLLVAEMSSKKMPDGKILAVVRDVTKRVKTEKQLKNALELYDMMAEATSDTIWDWDIVNQKMKYNKGIIKMFGYNVTEVGDAQEWWMRNVHPDDSKRIEGLTEKAFGGKKQTLHLEYRYRCASNNYKNILDRAVIMYDEAGKPVRMIGAMQDITFQREEEMHINRAIIDTQEFERQQMGMELHDNVNQILSAALIYLSTLKHFDASEESFTETLDLGKKLVLEGIGEIRRLSHQLAPASFEKISIKDVIVSLMETIKAADRYETDLRFTGDIKKIKGEIRINLYRILQEQMNNIIKYAEATKLEVSVEVIGKTVRLRVFDNGKGFDPTTIKKGIGLQNIQRRVNLYEGRFTLNTSPGKGCEIIAVLPIKEAKRA